MYDFDKVVNRQETNSIKWDILEKEGTPNAIPMWVADMDFQVAPPIIEAMDKVLQQKVFGYQYTSEDYLEAIVSWMARRHNYYIEKDWICYTPNVVAGLCMAVEAISEPGDEIIIQTPVHGPFYSSIRDNGRVIVENPLKYDNGMWTMDLDDFQQKITEKTKGIILCNPHNPCGRVWTKEELADLAALCVKHNLYIISDDIHGDLVFKGHKHHVIASLSEEVSKRTIVCTAPSKTFNLAGMQVAHCIVENEELREKFLKPLKKLHIEGGNSFEEAITVSAYTQCELWLKELLDYLEANVDYFVETINKEIPLLKADKPQGTYLVWVDCSQLNVQPSELRDFFAKTCGVRVNEGSFFGETGKHFVRFNVACPRTQIKQALEQIKGVLYTETSL